MSGSIKFSVLVEGLDSLSRAMKLANPECKRRVVDAIKHSTETVLQGAEARVHRASGELASTGRAEYGNDGLAGYVKFGFGTLQRRGSVARRGRKAPRSRGQAKLDLALANNYRQALSSADLGVYAPVPDRGDPRRHIEAQHYLDEPFAQEKPNAVLQINVALNGVTQGIAESAT